MKLVEQQAHTSPLPTDQLLRLQGESTLPGFGEDDENY